MKSTSLVTKFLGMLIIIGLLAGCAGQKQVARRYFWPPQPDTPRIEWLGAYQSQLDIRLPSWYASITGEEEPNALDRPLYIASDAAGKIYVSDVLRPAFMVFDFLGKDVHLLGGKEGIGLFEHPTGVDLDAAGNVYTADNKKKKIFVFGGDEKAKGALDLAGTVKSIGAFAIDRERRRIIVPDAQDHKVAVFDLAGKLLFSFGKRGTEDGEFNFPVAVALGKGGEIFVCDVMNARIQRFTPDGKFLLKFGERGDSPGNFALIKGVALDSENHVYVTDGKANTIIIFSDKGEFLTTLGATFAIEAGSKVTPGGFLVPQGIYIDKNDTIFVVDQLNHRFQKFQYLTERYLREHPIAGYQPPAKPGASLPVK